MAYIYGLCDPRNQQLRYVGVTKNPAERFKGHLKARSTCYSANWVKSLKRIDLKPEMFVIEEVDDDKWQEAEHFWIEYFRYIGANLTNMTSGGDGTRELSDEGRAKMRLAWNKRRGKPESEETRIKRSESHRGKRNVMYGKHHTLESRKKISAAKSGPNNHNFGKKMPQAQRRKIALALRGQKHPMFGRHHTEQTLEKMRKAHSGYKPSDETRRKVSIALSGKPKSPEHRAKLSEALLRFFHGDH